MAYTPKENTCNLFQNTKGKESNPKAPDLKGTANINNEIYYVSAWSNKDKNGNKYLSCTFKKANTEQYENPF